MLEGKGTAMKDTAIGRLGIAIALPLAVGATLLLAVAIASSTSALATNTVRISSKIKLSDGPPAFHGRIKSENKACAQQRRVKLFEKKRNGNRKLLGSTRSNRSGKWTVIVDPLKSGAYLAVAKKRREGTAGTIFVCRRAKSKLATVD
jgi:hypothetical protein